MYIKIYTDGAYSSKTNIGGWALISVPEVISTDNESHQYYYKDSGWEHNTTNNRMELYAMAKALQYARGMLSYENNDIQHITIYTDSAYIANAFKDKWFDKWRNNGWKTSKKTPVLNQDLWEAILLHYELNKYNITIEKVNGHAGNKWNELADQLAVAARMIGAKEQGEMNGTKNFNCNTN